MNENLKKQEQEFKAHCKEEMNRLKGNIGKLKTENDVELSDDKVCKVTTVITLFHLQTQFNAFAGDNF